MIKNPTTFDLVKMKEFIREPVEDINKKIENNKLKKIILNGGRGVGKSTVLANLELKGLGSENHYIYTHFDSIGFSYDSSPVYNEMFFIHYYELLLSRKILNYIKEYYSFTYENNFKGYDLILKTFFYEFDNYVNNYLFDKNVKIKTFLQTGELSSEILNKLTKSLNIERLSLAIDRFDWTNNESEISQEILSRYFDMFDKVIITTDDKTLCQKDNMDKIIEKGYSIITVDYGKNIDVLREIIRKRVQMYNQKIIQSDKHFPFYDITDDILESLITKTEGNIKMILKCLNDVNISFQWDEKSFDIEKEFDLAIQEQLQHSKQLEEMGRAKKLYL